MEKRYFSLEPVESNRLTRIFQLIFGIVCIVVAIFWLIYNIKSLKSDTTLWITITFLVGFSIYQINAGLGKATRFIEIDQEKIRMKRNSLLPVKEIAASEIEKIEMFPLNLVFFIREGRRIYLRFGTSLADKIEPIKNELANFADAHNINTEIKSEEL
jgi:hypothetical protein